MLYVQQSLGPEEEILISGRFHWMYTFNAVSWIFFGLAVGIAIGYAGIWWIVTSEIRALYPGLPDQLFQRAWNDTVTRHGGYLRLLWELHPGVRFGILGSFVLGLFFFANMMIIKATTEIAVTTERLIYKKGLISRHVGELNVDRIEGVSVYQGFFGRLLGYGRVAVRGMGVGEVLLPTIEAPVEFRRVVQEAKIMQEKGGNLRNTDEF